MRTLFIIGLTLLFFISPSLSVYPIAIFHGIGDGCNFKNTSTLVNNLAKDLNTHVECIEIGNGFITSWFRNFTKQAEEACQNIKENPNFQGKFSVIGISQGTLIGRYVVEACNMTGQVMRYLSLDGPQMGIGSLPKITCPIICDWINRLVSKIIYTDVVVANLGPASYYKYKYNYALFLKKNKFLRDLNNEGEIKNALYKERFSNLEKVMLIRGKQDSVITPSDSSWFEFYDEKGDKIVSLQESKFYIDDYIGLRKLAEEGRVQFVEFEGEHVIYNQTEYELYMRDFFADE